MTPEQLARSGTEHAEQMALFAWANAVISHGFDAANKWAFGESSLLFYGGSKQPGMGIAELRWLHAIPNAGARGNKVAAAQLKAEGVKAGVGDIFLPATRQRPHLTAGLYVELKRANGVPSDVSKEQIEFARFVKSQGYAWYVAFGWREAAHIIESYLKCVTPSLTKKQAQVLALVEAG